MRKPKTLSKLKKELDKAFNAFIRNRDIWFFGSNSGYHFKCISCNEVKSIEQMHAGHFYARTFTATRWDERNVNGQCVGCNTFRHGNLLEYRKGMLAKYGPEVLEELEVKKNQVFKLNREWLTEMIELYKNKI